MFCEKCGAQIPDGSNVLCANCQASMNAINPNYGQPDMQAGQQYQQYNQPTQGGFSLNAVMNNPLIMLAAKLVLGAFSLWAAFGPLLSYICFSIWGISVTYSFMDFFNLSGGEIIGYFVPMLICMILSILLSLGGIVMALLPKAAPQVKLPVSSNVGILATAASLFLSIVSQFITIGFVSTSEGYATLSGFGVFMMIMSFLFLACSVFIILIENKIVNLK